MSYDKFRRSRYLVDHLANAETSKEALELVICPACEAELYLPDGDRVPDHIAEHQPEDFGLSSVRVDAAQPQREVA